MLTKKKIVKITILGFLLLCLYGIIFGFSGQDGTESSGLSSSLTIAILQFFRIVPKADFTIEQLTLIENMEHFIRKAGHFSEYAAMGMLTFGIFSTLSQKLKKCFRFSILWVFVSAAADEFHQYFVPGRWASFLDVLLDTCGGFTGAGIVLLIVLLINKKAHSLDQ